MLTVGPAVLNRLFVLKCTHSLVFSKCKSNDLFTIFCGVGISCNLQLQAGQSDGVEDFMKGVSQGFFGASLFDVFLVKLGCWSLFGPFL